MLTEGLIREPILLPLCIVCTSELLPLTVPKTRQTILAICSYRFYFNASLLPRVAQQGHSWHCHGDLCWGVALPGL